MALSPEDFRDDPDAGVEPLEPEPEDVGVEPLDDDGDILEELEQEWEDEEAHGGDA